MGVLRGGALAGGSARDGYCRKHRAGDEGTGGGSEVRLKVHRAGEGLGGNTTEQEGARSGPEEQRAQASISPQSLFELNIDFYQRLH